MHRTKQFVEKFISNVSKEYNSEIVQLIKKNYVNVMLDIQSKINRNKRWKYIINFSFYILLGILTLGYAIFVFIDYVQKIQFPYVNTIGKCLSVLGSILIGIPKIISDIANFQAKLEIYDRTLKELKYLGLTFMERKYDLKYKKCEDPIKRFYYKISKTLNTAIIKYEKNFNIDDINNVDSFIERTSGPTTRQRAFSSCGQEFFKKYELIDSSEIRRQMEKPI